MALIIFLIILSILVLIHEFGHFWTAKKFGIKVEEFGFGFPPKAFSIKKGETVYSINWLPIGGFVKLYGEDEAGGGKVKIPNSKFQIPNSDVKRAFFARPVSQRALVVVAGVIMNTLLAILIFYAFVFISNFKTQILLPPFLSDHKFFFVNQQNVSQIIINNVVKDSPAEKAGISPFSKIVSINSQKIEDSSKFTKVISENKGKEIIITWQDIQTGKQKSAKIIPRANPPKNQGALGISFYPVITANLNYETLFEKAFSGISHPLNILSYNFEGIEKLVAISLKQKSAAPLGDTVSGPVGIYSITKEIGNISNIKERILQYLNLAGILSITLAFFNVLPIPALDGGRLFFILVEAAIGKKVSPRVEAMIHTVGMVILLGLIVLITFKDITRFLK